MPVVILVADGARVDAFTGELAHLPAIRRLRDEGGLHAVTSVFPSVTGPAYTPFLVGRYPGPVGIPGIRWFDRSRSACSWPTWCRSYVGYEFSRMNCDLDTTAPTIFELVPKSVGAMSVITRGLARGSRYGTLTLGSALRVARTHFRGKADGWLEMDREVMETIPRVLREERPDYVFAALVGVDKGSHADGHESALVADALQLVDATVARIRSDAEAGGWWDDTHLWIVSDHGHSRVHSHDDLAGVIAATGARTIAHPWAVGVAPDAAVMVSGNAMAHIYLRLDSRERPWWGALEERWSALAAALLVRPSADLLLLPLARERCEIRSHARGTAEVSRVGDEYRYTRMSGDPLGIAGDLRASADETWDALKDSDYPDAIVQIVSLAGSARAGDIIVSAAPGWDLRARYEPIPHASAHGALHRDHMVVPLITNRPIAATARRTTDVFASALAALRIPAPANLDGRSFL